MSEPLNRRSFFTTAASGLACLMGAKPATAASDVLYANADVVRRTGFAYDVWCDGRKLKFAKEANAVEGTAVCFAEDRSGRKYIEKDALGNWQVATHVVRGNIVIRRGRKRES